MKSVNIAVLADPLAAKGWHSLLHGQEGRDALSARVGRDSLGLCFLPYLLVALWQVFIIYLFWQD